MFPIVHLAGFISTRFQLKTSTLGSGLCRGWAVSRGCVMVEVEGVLRLGSEFRLISVGVGLGLGSTSGQRQLEVKDNIKNVVTTVERCTSHQPPPAAAISKRLHG